MNITYALAFNHIRFSGGGRLTTLLRLVLERVYFRGPTLDFCASLDYTALWWAAGLFSCSRPRL
jgi:hypothetical protein